MQRQPVIRRETFVGREPELAIVGRRLATLRDGSGGVILVAGEPGIGKTRLAEETAALAPATGVRVLWGRAHETEGAPAFWPWIQVIRAYVREHDVEALRTELGVSAAAIAQLVPELTERLGPQPPPPALDGDEARFYLFDSVSTFLRAAARAQPLLIVLDDLHWADPLSIFLLQFVARDLRGVPVLLLGTYRDIEVQRGHPLAQAVAALARDQGTERIELRGLVQPDVVRFVESTVGRQPGDALVAMLTRRTEGNPFFLSELARLLANEGRLDAWSAEHDAGGRRVIPETVRETIGRRLDRLSRECYEALSAAAVLGRDFSLRVLERVLDSADNAAPADLLEAAAAARLIVELPDGLGRYRFAHELIRETLYEDLPRSRRTHLHRRIGEVLESLYGIDVAQYLPELANHFVQAATAGDVGKGVDYSRRAGDQAMAVAAYEDAAGHFSRALQLLDLRSVSSLEAPFGADAERCDLLLRLGDAQRAAGELEAKRETFQRAAALTRHLRSPERLARAALGFSGETPQAGWVNPNIVQILEEALAEIAGIDGGLRAMLLTRLAFELYSSEWHDRSLALGREALAMARHAGEAPALAYALSFEALTIDVERRLMVADEILRLAADLDRSGRALLSGLARSEAARNAGWGLNRPGRALLIGHTSRIASLLERGEIAAVERVIDHCERLADEVRQPALRAVSTLYRATLALHAGRLVHAEELAQRALALGQRVGIANAPQFFAGQLFLLRIFQGRLVELEGAIQSFVAQYPTLHVWRCARAWFYTEVGRPADARAELDSIVAHDLSDLPRDYLWLTALFCLAESCAALGDARRAALLYGQLLPFADRNAVVGVGYTSLGSVARLLGLLAAVLERRADAAAHFESALEMNERIGAWPWLARTQLDYARMLLDGGRAADVERALALLTQAGATAHTLGLTRIAEQSNALIQSIEQEQALLDAAGMQATTPSGTRRRQANPAGLSDREVEILRLLAEGCTNQEIAEALVLSIRTVENHLARIYSKIGARGRTEATAYAFRQSLL